MTISDIIFQSGEFFNERSWWSNVSATLLAVIIPFAVLFVQKRFEISNKRREKAQDEKEFYNYFKFLAGRCIKTIDTKITLIDKFIEKFNRDEPSIFRVDEVITSDLRNFLIATSPPAAFNAVRRNNLDSDMETTFYKVRQSIARALEVISQIIESNIKYLELTHRSIEKLKLKVEESLIFDITNFIKALKNSANPPSNIEAIEDHLNNYRRLVVSRVKSGKPVTSGDLHKHFLTPLTSSMVSLLGNNEAEQFLERLRSANWIYGSAITDQDDFLDQVKDFKKMLVEDKDEIERSLKLMN